MNISGRERILLILMGAALVLFLSYSFLIKPLLDSISQADIDIAAAQEQKNNLDITTAVKVAVDKKNAELDVLLQDTLKAFYPQLEIKSVFKFLSDSVENAGLNPAVINLSQLSLSYPDTGAGSFYSEINYELYDMAKKIAKANEVYTQQMQDEQSEQTAYTSDTSQALLTESREAQITFNGDIARLRELLAIIEQHNRSIVVSSFNFERDEVFDGNISFTIFALPKPFEDNSGFAAYN